MIANKKKKIKAEKKNLDVGDFNLPTNEIIKTRHLPFIGHLIGSGLILNILSSIASPGMSSHKYDKSSRLSVNHKNEKQGRE